MNWPWSPQALSEALSSASAGAQSAAEKAVQDYVGVHSKAVTEQDSLLKICSSQHATNMAMADAMVHMASEASEGIKGMCCNLVLIPSRPPVFAPSTGANRSCYLMQISARSTSSTLHRCPARYPMALRLSLHTMPSLMMCLSSVRWRCHLCRRSRAWSAHLSMSCWSS